MSDTRAALPGELPPEVRHLVGQLREAKRRTGLSYAALGAKTGYSKSSWERYLNGKALPPRQAVAALARLGGTEPARLLALWELADHAWSGRAARNVPGPPEPPPASPGERPAPPATPAPGSDPHAGSEPGPAPRAGPGAGARRAEPAPPHARRRRGTAAAATAVAALAALLATGVLALGAGADEGDQPEPSAVGTCRGEECTGRNAEGGDTDCWVDAQTAAAHEVLGRTVELRTSPTCEAAWARLVEPRAGDLVWVETEDERRSQLAASDAQFMYTLMVGGVVGPGGAGASAVDARACFELAGGERGCAR